MKRYSIFLIAFAAVCLTACTSWKSARSAADCRPVIFPDYAEVTIPSNIAPLNFMVEDAGRIQVIFCHEGNEILKVRGREGVVRIPLKKWREMLRQAAGGNIDVYVSVWSEVYPQGVAYLPFPIHVEDREIDPWVAYRLIEPGYVSWRQLGLYQRDLTSFRESAIVTNHETTTTCLNCHHFPSYSSGSMMFHARGANGGTILYHNGKLSKINFNEIWPKKNATYPAWHPQGRYIAFSSNTTHQVFFGEGRQQVEVFDTASDLIVYDTGKGEVLVDPRFLTEESLETFPAWSPDGKHLYFASYTADSLPVEFSLDMHYDLLRVAFDPHTGSFDAQVDTLYNSRKLGGSVSYPRVSQDGRYLLYTWSDYGTFPIWHQDADLRMMDLQTMEDVDVSALNSSDQADSYHSWSSDGRWVIFGSRRLDGRYTRLFIAYIDENGKPDKPFLLPQEDPRQHTWRLKSFNVPEFIDGEVKLPKEAEELFKTEE